MTTTFKRGVIEYVNITRYCVLADSQVSVVFAVFLN
jgi:hypothetical protein